MLLTGGAPQNCPEAHHLLPVALSPGVCVLSSPRGEPDVGTWLRTATLTTVTFSHSHPLIFHVFALLKPARPWFSALRRLFQYIPLTLTAMRYRHIHDHQPCRMDRVTQFSMVFRNDNKFRQKTINENTCQHKN